MDASLLRNLYTSRGYDEEKINQANQAVMDFEQALAFSSISLNEASVADVRAHVQRLMQQRRNTLEHLLALARYFYLINHHEVYVYFTSLLGGMGVIDRISERMRSHLGASETEEFFSQLVYPELGTEPRDFPAYTEKLMARLEAKYPVETVAFLLAGNNHDIPSEKFIKEREILNRSDTLDDYLRDYNLREINVLQEHADKHIVWFEQVITQEVVDFVKGNQEIMSAVRDGDKLYTTKIPYDPVNYLRTDDPLMKRYYACHCPFAREAILNKEVSISSNWCYCSGGFAKHPYEVLFNRPLKVKLLNSALAGDPICRFEIDIHDVVS